VNGPRRSRLTLWKRTSPVQWFTRSSTEGGQAVGNRVDVADEKAVSDMVAEASEKFGRLDIVINNAGVVPFGHLEQTSDEDLMQALRAMWPGPSTWRKRRGP
jgi:NAD(P)-dependent dehydrogenase (short-subunit alcohol dehydrogenase family)